MLARPSVQCQFGAPVVEAHRGDSAGAPENTMAAFRLAVDAGVSWIELDVHLTRDGFPVVMHDGDTARTTGIAGEIRGLDLADVRRLDAGSWYGTEFAGEPVPRLEDVIDLVNGTQTQLNVEIKGGVSPEGAGAIVCALASRGDATHIVSSFQVESLLTIRQIAPCLSLALIGSATSVLAGALKHGFEWIHVSWRSVNIDLVARAHAAGIRVNTWTVDRPVEYSRFARLGLEKICTNDPCRMLRAAAAWQPLLH